MVQRVTVYKCQDGELFEDVQDARLHEYKITADSRLSDFIIMECSSAVKFHDTNALVDMVRAITKEFVVIRRSQAINLGALEVELCSLRGELVKPTVETLLKMLLKSEEVK